MQMEKASRKFTKHTRRMYNDNTSITSHVEECLTLMDTLTVNEEDKEVTDLMESLTVTSGGIDEGEKEDMSYWEELEILNEEDFSSPEEYERIETAERELMTKYKENVDLECQEENFLPEKNKPTNVIEENREGNSSLEEDALPEGTSTLKDEVPAESSPLDNFLNR